MRALIIGGTGFIGSHAVRRFLAGGAEVTVFGPPVPGPDLLADLAGRVGRIEGDVRESARVLAVVQEWAPDLILHLAAFGAGGEGLVKASMGDPVKAVEVNVNGFLSTLEAARTCAVRRVVWTSTTAMLGQVARYGGAASVDEEAPAYPAHIYGATKVLAEHLARHYRQAYGLEIVGMRPTIVYGPGLWYRGVAGAIAEMFSAAAAGRPHRVEDSGEPWDLLYVKDAAAALWRLATAEWAGPDLVHVNGHTASVGQVAAAISRAAPGASLEVVPGGRTLGIPLVRTERAARWGIEPAYDLDTAVRDFLSELREGSS